MPPVALLSDIHGNSPALQAVLEDVAGQGCDALIVLGDVCPGVDPQGCLDLLKNWPHIEYLRGNAEAYLLTPELEDLPAERGDAGLLSLIRWLQAHITPSDLARIATWPEALYRDGACLVHDSPFDRFFPHEWQDPSLPAHYQEWFHHSAGLCLDMDNALRARLLAWMEKQCLSILFCGHTHRPFLLRLAGRLVCNAGSVGLPLDGDPRAAWVLWKPDAPGEEAVSIRRVGYNVCQAQQMIAATPTYLAGDRPGMRAAHQKMLETGIHWRAHLDEKG